MNDFSTSDLFSKLMRYWWIITGLMILGGLLGLLASNLIKPIFESESVITSTLDYGQLGRMDDWKEDQVYRAIGDIIGSTEVKTRAVEQANLAGLKITLSEFEEKASLDRQDTRWVMRIRDESPEYAQKLNSFWAAAAVDSLAEMNSRNESAFAYQQYINSLTDCFEQSVVVEPASFECNSQSLEEIRKEMAAADENANGIGYVSSLVFSHTSFGLTTESTLPTSPVLFARGGMVIAGAFIGLCLGLLLFLSGWPKEKQASSL
jgi:uncharacterized protein involved in exopolysaccharide biosynthesis